MMIWVIYILTIYVGSSVVAFRLDVATLRKVRDRVAVRSSVALFAIGMIRLIWVNIVTTSLLLVIAVFFIGGTHLFTVHMLRVFFSEEWQGVRVS